MERPTFSVSGLVAVINQSLEYAYPMVEVEGEISSFKVSKNKYVFFDIKDDDAAIGCFMMVYHLRVALQDGMRMRLIAQPRLTTWGKFSLTVRDIVPVGEGSIKKAFELLRSKLQAEGLFDPERKRSLPFIPERVGLIASVESAGYSDFLKILAQRWGGVEVQVADVQVQGWGAARQIVAALEHFNQQADLPDVLVVVRGGGSSEDLAVFNDEGLVRAIAASRIPTLVGVGHEVDNSLADLAADVRAATPSNAAQLLVPDRQAVLAGLAHANRRLAERLAFYAQRTQQKVVSAPPQMLGHIQTALRHRQQQLAHAGHLLRQVDPRVVLRRGYSLVRDQNGAVVRDAADHLRPGSQLTVTTSCAIIQAGVIDVQRQKPTIVR